MTEDELADARLSALFAVPQGAPDEAFIDRIQRAVLIEERLASARRTAWRRFAVEAAASAAVAATFVLLGRLAPLTLELGEGPLSPAVTGALILGLWFMVELRPAATER